MARRLKTIAYRRRRTGKTDYLKRKKLLSSGIPRLVIRKSLNALTAQIVQHQQKGDKVIASARTSELEKQGWKFSGNNLSTGYLVGLLIAKKAKEKQVKKAVLDLGLYRPIKGSKLFAVLKGAVDNGLEVPHSEDVLPDEKRIKGEHIAQYAKILKKEEPQFQKQFSNYIKKGANPEKITEEFEKIKNKLMEK